MHPDGGAFEELLLRIAVDRGIAFDPRPDGVDEVQSWLARTVDLAAARLPEPDQRRWLAAALSALWHQVQLSTLPDLPPLSFSTIALPAESLRGQRRKPRWPPLQTRSPVADRPGAVCRLIVGVSSLE
jgi:hypothetical protein